MNVYFASKNVFTHLLLKSLYFFFLLILSVLSSLDLGPGGPRSKWVVLYSTHLGHNDFRAVQVHVGVVVGQDPSTGVRLVDAAPNNANHKPQIVWFEYVAWRSIHLLILDKGSIVTTQQEW